MPGATAILLRSLVVTVPGAGFITALGAVAVLVAWFTPESEHAGAFLSGGLALSVGFPLLFCGARFRDLASRRMHALLPGFEQALLSATGALFAALAAWTTVALVVAGRVPAAIHPVGGVLALACGAYGVVFAIGFFPALVRLAFWLVLVAGAAGTDGAGAALEALLRHPGVVATITACGAAAFTIGFKRRWRARRLYPDMRRTILALPLGLVLPSGLAPGTAAGTQLLKTSDAPVARLARAAVGVVLIPVALAVALRMGAGLDWPHIVGEPVLWFMALVFAFGLFVHLAHTVAQRLPVVWLRCDLPAHDVWRLGERVLLREAGSLVAVLLALGGASAAAVTGSGLKLAGFLALWTTALAFEGYLAMWLRAFAARVDPIWPVMAHLLFVVAVLALPRAGVEVDFQLPAAVVQAAAALALRFHLARGERK